MKELIEPSPPSSIMLAVARYMNAPPGQYSSALACLRDTVAGEGPGALYRYSTVQYSTVQSSTVLYRNI